MAESAAEQGRKESQAGGGNPSDIHRLSRCGQSLYELLDIPKESTHEDIRRKYRRLALKYHPDKNPDNPEAEEMFKKINHANSILSDEKKREIYDKYGSFGLYIAEQFGDEVVDHVMLFSSKWFQCIFWSCCLLTGCFFCCCGFCCGCCFCCGKCKPEPPEDTEVPDVADFEDEANQAQGGATSGPSANDSSKPTNEEVVVTAQPKAAANDSGGGGGAIPLGGGPPIIAMPPPPAYEEALANNTKGPETTTTAPGESTALNNGDKVGYTPDMTTNTTPKKVPPQNS